MGNNANELTEENLTTKILQFLSEHIILVIVLAYFFYFSVNFIGALIKEHSKSKYSLRREDFIALDKSIGMVLDSKARRFADKAKEVLRKPGALPGEIFNDITQPLDQIRLLTVALHTFLSFLDI